MINNTNVALAAVALLGIAGHEVCAAAPPDDVLSLPPECHAEGFRQDAFLDWDAMSFEQQTPQQHTRFVWKYDVVCMAPNIHLTTNIYTNGGDVYLFGDSVTIDAHIDTRVYRPYELSDFFLPQPLGMPADYSNKYLPYMTAMFSATRTLQALTRPDADPLYGTQKLLAAFQDFYRCGICRKGRAGSDYVARMPDGATPPFGSFAGLPGLPAPNDTVDRATFRSGSVFIAAINVNLKGDLPDLKPKIVTAGLPGGIGGLGEPWYCTGFPVAAATCGLVPFGRSLSGPGGPGGDAGNVYFYTSADQRALNADQYVDVAAGISAPQTLFQQPGDNRDAIKNLQGKASDFAVAEPKPDIPDGAIGVLSLNQMPANQLLGTFLDQLNAGTGLREYSIQDLAQRALDDPDVKWKSFFDYVAASLAQDLSERLIFYARATSKFVRDGTIQQNPRGESAYCGRVDQSSFVREDLTVFSNMLSKMCLDDTFPKPLPEYFDAIGGASDLPNPNIGVELRVQALLSIVNLTEADLRQLQLEVNQLNQTNVAIFEQDALARLEQKKRDLEQQVAALEQNSSGHAALVALGSALVSFVTGVNGVFGALDDLDSSGHSKDGQWVPWTDAERNQQAKALASGASDAAGAFGKIQSAWTELQHSQGEMPGDLSGQISQVIEEMRDLVASVAAEQAQLRAQNLAFTDALFLSLSRYSEGERDGISNVPTLLRTILTDYIADPSRDADQVSSNTEALVVYIQATSPLLLQFNAVDATCQVTRDINVGTFVRGTEDCVRVRTGDKPLVLYAKFQTKNGGLSELPLYHFASGPAEFRRPLYGVSEYRLSVAQGAADALARGGLEARH